jgi:hypothetical protein
MVKQRRGETLRDFWVRFNSEALDVTDFDIEQRRRIMYNNVLSQEVSGVIIRATKVKTLERLYEELEPYMVQEEAILSSRASATQHASQSDRKRDREQSPPRKKISELRSTSNAPSGCICCNDRKALRTKARSDT